MKAPLLAALLIVFPAVTLKGDLLNPVVAVDTQLQFLGAVDYRGPLTADTIRFKPATVDPMIPADLVTVNWVITVRQGRFDLVPPAAANDIQVSGVHQVPPPGPPHGEGVGGLLGPLEFSQGNLGAGVNTNPGATVVDAMGAVRILITSRPHGAHVDFLQARMDSIGANISRISIQADHLGRGMTPVPVPKIPEPSSMLLFGTGIAGLILRRTRNTRVFRSGRIITTR